MNVKAKDTLERMKTAVMGTFDIVHYVFVFWGFFCTITIIRVLTNTIIIRLF
jgi:hypothetical protein